MPYLVIHARCRYEPPSDTDVGGVRCTVVEYQFCATNAESWERFGAMRRAQARFQGPAWALPITQWARVATADDAFVARFLREQIENPSIQQRFANVCEGWIDGTLPDEVTLTQARAYPGADAMAKLSWQYHQYIYVMCPVALIHCDEATLRQLLVDVNAAARASAAESKPRSPFVLPGAAGP